MPRAWRSLAAFAAVVVAFDAGAASFDCAKATRPQEKLVCSDPVLSKLDERMAASLPGRTGPSFGTRQERAARRTEGLAPLLAAGLQLREGVASFSTRMHSACARVRYELRIEALKVDDRVRREVQGLQRGRLRCAMDAEGGGRVGVVVGHSWVYPQVEVAGLGATDARFARAINAWIAPARKAIQSKFADDLMTSATGTTLRTVTTRILGATTEDSWWGVGAAHSIEGIEHRYFDRRHMRPLRAGRRLQGKGVGHDAP